MIRTRSALLAIAAAAATTFATAATAQAACTYSSGSGYSYGDLDNDSERGLAPEISTVRIDVDNACTLVVDPGILRPLGDDDAAFVYIDTDGNAGTGDPEMGGADIVVLTIGDDEGQSAPMRGVWDGETFAFADADPIGPNVGNGGFRASLDRLPIASGVYARFVVVSATVVGDDIVTDIAPTVGSMSVRVNYSTTPLTVIVPKTTPTPLPPRFSRIRPEAPRTVTPQPPAPKRCAVPRTKGLTVAAAKARLAGAGCTIATTTTRSWSPTVRKGRVVGTTVPAGRTSASAFRLVVSKGKRPRRQPSLGRVRSR